MIEDDEEQMREELKEAFRIYDKDNQGFITNEILKVNIGKYIIFLREEMRVLRTILLENFYKIQEILREIDSTLTEEDLEGIVEEVDEDGSGTMDFDEFQEMMMG